MSDLSDKSVVEKKSDSQISQSISQSTAQPTAQPVVQPEQIPQVVKTIQTTDQDKNKKSSLVHVLDIPRKPEMVDIKTAIKERGLSGITNFGATCYMNAAIQALGVTVPFVAYMTYENSELRTHLINRILDDKYVKHEKENEEKGISRDLNISMKELCKDAENKLGYMLRIVMKRLWAHNCEVNPRRFKRLVDRFLKYFVGGVTQHDSQEFLSAVLDNIHETTKADGVINVEFDEEETVIDNTLNMLRKTLEIAQKQKDRETIKMVLDKINKLYLSDKKRFLFVSFVQTWRNVLKIGYSEASGYSVINDIFSGTSLTTITCTTCNTSIHRFERFDILTLHLPETIDEKKTSYTLDELMNIYTETEHLKGENSWYCNYCDAKTEAKKKLTIYQQPNTLVILIKKYQKYNGKLFKSNIKINYDHEFNLEPFTTEYTNGITNYELYSCIRHDGGFSGGHYYTYGKSPLNNLWYLYDDGCVYSVESDEPLRSNAYILLFRQKEKISVNDSILKSAEI
jgi:ubiquitin C-terminal hydrolase